MSNFFIFQSINLTNISILLKCYQVLYHHELNLIHKKGSINQKGRLSYSLNEKCIQEGH